MMPSWTLRMTSESELDIAPRDGPTASYTIEKTATLLEQFDRNAAAARTALMGTSDESFQQPWVLKSGGQEVATGTRYLMIRTLLLNHLVHHRAQLGVYLRLVNVPVPSMYGPTADEKV